MHAALSTTRWRDQPIVPRDYEDRDGLVKLAGDARERQVEFDWVLSQDELLQLRQAVFEWSARVRGRYRAFDARVLAAINAALGDTTFVRQEPSNAPSIDCEVSCVQDGDLYLLRGHATFDIVFGYGSAGVEPSGPGSAHLGSTLREMLASSVGTLGWDLHRLQDEHFRPVWNALYGLGDGYGEPQAVPTGPVIDVEVHFQGPFSAFEDAACPCLFTHDVAQRRGVYLWTIEDRPWYVGQTARGFGIRIGEHIAAYLSGAYETDEAEALLQGRHALAGDADLWAHNLPERLPMVLANYDRLLPTIMKLLRALTIYVAPLDGDVDRLRHIEAAIGRHYLNHANEALRILFTWGIKLPALPRDKRYRLSLTSDVPIAGLPKEISTWLL